MKTFLYMIRDAGVSLSVFLMLCTGTLSAQQSYTFTNAGATGRFGPTQTQVNTAYGSTNLSGAVVVTGGIQTWTVPQSGNYRITVAGAKGGDGRNGSVTTPAGNGAIVRAEFNLTGGQTLAIACGQMGISSTSSDTGGGGGGGSYVASSNTPLIVAGGGGSGGDNNTGATSGTTYTYGLQGNNSGGAGGTNGGGGTGYGSSGGGGGFSTNGTTSAGGLAFLNGATGGAGTYGDGGFGGGGGGNDATNDNGAGGGGYSGGGGGGNNAAGGGGGSFIATSATSLASSNGLYNGNSVQNLAAFNTGHGYVIIDELCSISLTAAGASNSISPVMCSGQSLTLTTNAVSGYSWSTGVTGTNQIVVSPTSNTVYAITATSSLACTTTSSMSVVVSSGMPVVTLSATSNSVCLGESVALNAAGALTYTYYNSIVPGVYFNPSVTATYSVAGQNGCGTSGAVTTVTVYQLQVAAIANPTLVCASTISTLTAAGAQTYTWLPNNVPGNPYNAFPSSTEVYTVIGQSGNCLGQATVQVQTKANPTINIAASGSLICEGESVTMSLSGADTYTWQNTSLSGANVTVSPTAPTAYNVAGTNSLGCTSGAQHIVIVNQKPTVNAASNPASICVGASATLSAGGADAYAWSDGSSGQSVVVSPVTTTNYVVTGTENTHGCTASVTVPVSVYQATISVSQNTFICPGDVALVSAGSANSYTWVNGGSAASMTVSPAATTIYTINATGNVNNMTCITTNTVEVGVHPAAVVTASASRGTICRDETTTITATGGNTYLWNTGATASVLVVVGFQSGTLNYTVTGTDQNGCKDADNLSVVVSNCVGFEELSGAASVNVYPNPSQGTFVVEGSGRGNLTLINELGQAVQQHTAVDLGSGPFTVSNLEKGFYLLIFDGGQRYISRIIVQ